MAKQSVKQRRDDVQRRVSSHMVQRGKRPSKTRINFAILGEKPINWFVAVPSIIAIVVGAFFLSKVAVVDRYSALNEAKSRASSAQAQVEQLQSEINEYGELVEKYSHYTYSGMSASELALRDRVEIMDMLKRVVSSRCVLGNWSIVNNQAELTITGSSLEQINSIVQALQGEDMVDYCTVSTAATNDEYRNTDGDVTANVTVYFLNAE